MVSLVYLAARASEEACCELRRAGYQVTEAFSVPEALWLCSQHYAETVVISAEFTDSAVIEVYRRYYTVQLKTDAHPQDIFTELPAAS